VRGGEFTRQLYHFTGCIADRNVKNRCGFAGGADVIETIERIFADSLQNTGT
jgi:hypothetical protein